MSWKNFMISLSAMLVFGGPIGAVGLVIAYTIFDWISSHTRPESMENAIILLSGLTFGTILSIPGVILAHIVQFKERQVGNAISHVLYLILVCGYTLIIFWGGVYMAIYTLIGPPLPE
jgi:O-antigen/teichoic acid export membrane protein